jgi:ferritin
MLTGKMQAGLNKQINAELYSAYLYLSMSAYFQSLNLRGGAHWFYCQAHEELIHALKLYLQVFERNGQVTLTAIEGPPTEWASPLAAFEAAYAHEQLVTSMINDLVNLAVEEKDHASNAFLQWYVTEQVEEEASASEVAQKLRLAGDQGAGLFLVDQELATRIPPFVIPIPPAAGGAPAGGA